MCIRDRPNIVQEMAAALRTTKAQLDMVTAQLAHLERQKLLAEVTSKELDSYPTDTVWRGCGKMFILQDKKTYSKDLSHDEQTVKDQIKALQIKKNYLQTTVDNTVESLRRVVG